MNIGDLLMSALVLNLLIIGLFTIFITSIGYFTIKFWDSVLLGVKSGAKLSFKFSPVISIVLIFAIITGGLIIYNNYEKFEKFLSGELGYINYM